MSPFFKHSYSKASILTEKHFKNKTIMDMENVSFELPAELQKTIEAKVKELKAADPKVKRIYPIVVEGDPENDEKDYYVGYFRQPSFPTFSKYLAASQSNNANAMRQLAKDCLLAGDSELVEDESLFLFGLMAQMSKIVESRNGRVVNLSKAGK